MIEEVFSITKSTLLQGRKLNISGFGSFVVKQKKDRKWTGGQVHERVDGDKETSIHPAPVGKIEL